MLTHCSLVSLFFKKTCLHFSRPQCLNAFPLGKVDVILKPKNTEMLKTQYNFISLTRLIPFLIASICFSVFLYCLSLVLPCILCKCASAINKHHKDTSSWSFERVICITISLQVERNKTKIKLFVYLKAQWVVLKKNKIHSVHISW